MFIISLLLNVLPLNAIYMYVNADHHSANRMVVTGDLFKSSVDESSAQEFRFDLEYALDCGLVSVRLTLICYGSRLEMWTVSDVREICFEICA